MSFMYVDVSPAPLVKACERLRRGHRIWLNSMNFQIQADSCFFLHTIYVCIAGKSTVLHSIRIYVVVCIAQRE